MTSFKLDSASSHWRKSVIDDERQKSPQNEFETQRRNLAVNSARLGSFLRNILKVHFHEPLENIKKMPHRMAILEGRIVILETHEFSTDIVSFPVPDVLGLSSSVVSGSDVPVSSSSVASGSDVPILSSSVVSGSDVPVLSSSVASGSDVSVLSSSVVPGSDASVISSSVVPGSDASVMSSSDASGSDVSVLSSSVASGSDASVRSSSVVSGSDVPVMSSSVVSGSDVPVMSSSVASGSDASVISSSVASGSLSVIPTPSSLAHGSLAVHSTLSLVVSFSPPPPPGLISNINSTDESADESKIIRPEGEKTRTSSKKQEKRYTDDPIPQILASINYSPRHVVHDEYGFEYVGPDEFPVRKPDGSLNLMNPDVFAYILTVPFLPIEDYLISLTCPARWNKKTLEVQPGATALIQGKLISPSPLFKDFAQKEHRYTICAVPMSKVFDMVRNTLPP